MSWAWSTGTAHKFTIMCKKQRESCLEGVDIRSAQISSHVQRHLNLRNDEGLQGATPRRNDEAIDYEDPRK